MTISHHIPVVVAAMFQIFSYFVWSVTEVSQIAAIVRFTIEEWGLIVARVVQLQNQGQLIKPHQTVPVNAPELQKRVADVKTGLLIQTDVVIYTNNYNSNLTGMNVSLLFAIDTNTEDVIVSISPKGSNQINFVERIERKDNEVLYSSVLTLTAVTHSPNFDTAIFKSMDKVCQMIYNKHKEAN